MKGLLVAFKKDPALVVSTLFLLGFSLLVLHSIAPASFPVYYLYLAISILAFLLFSQIDFEILIIFSKFFYVASLIFLLLPLLIGQVTRGAIRWIPIGPLTIQPAEIVRPFLFVFFANFLLKKELKGRRILELIVLLIPPLFLILIQPSLGVTILTSIGILGIFLASGPSRKLLITVFLVVFLVLPASWFLLAPYQKARILTFVNPFQDPTGAGYNSIQSMIAVGSGGIWGRGLGEGSQTQLAFLPERHTDFIFASIAEELGFAGAALILIGSFFLLYRIIKAAEEAVDPYARAFITGVFLSLFSQTLIHIGMNLGLFPITGLPLPLVSAGGSSLLATMIALGMVIGAKKGAS